jgi:uncharacterized protein (DUF2141 family)
MCAQGEFSRVRHADSRISCKRPSWVIPRMRRLTFTILVTAFFSSTTGSLHAAFLLDGTYSVATNESSDLDMDRIRANDPLGIEMPSMGQSDSENEGWDDGYEGVITLSITVAGIADNRGKIILLAYDDEQAFQSGDANAAVGHVEADAKAGSVTVYLPVYGLGPYAIVALHDANGDNELNLQNGRPLEGYGVSGGLDPYSAVQNFNRAATVQREANVRIVYHSNPFR